MVARDTLAPTTLLSPRNLPLFPSRRPQRDFTYSHHLSLSPLSLLFIPSRAFAVLLPLFVRDRDRRAFSFFFLFFFYFCFHFPLPPSHQEAVVSRVVSRIGRGEQKSVDTDRREGEKEREIGFGRFWGKEWNYYWKPVESVWRILSLERSRFETNNGQLSAYRVPGVIGGIN